MSVMLVVAWVVTTGLRRVAVRYAMLRHVWHPGLFVFAVYLIVLLPPTNCCTRATRCW